MQSNQEFIKLPLRLIDASTPSLLGVNGGCGCTEAVLSCGEHTGCGLSCSLACGERCYLTWECNESCSQSCSQDCSQTPEACTTICEICESNCELHDLSINNVGSIKRTEATWDSITIYYTSISKADSYEIAYCLNEDDSKATYVETEELYYVITDLDPNTEYVVNYRGLNNYSTGPFMEPGLVVKTKSLIDPWDWNKANKDLDGNGEATAALTREFYEVLHGRSKPENGFSCHVWNDIVSKANDIATVYGSGWYPYGGLSMEDCKVSSGEFFSAKKYNCVRFNIGSIKSTGIYDKSRDDPVFGELITTLTETINAIINEG